MTDIKMTREQHETLSRIESSLDSLYEWLEKCVGEADAPLRSIIGEKIAALLPKLQKLTVNN